MGRGEGNGVVQSICGGTKAALGHGLTRAETGSKNRPRVPDVYYSARTRVLENSRIIPLSMESLPIIARTLHFRQLYSLIYTIS